MTELLGSCDHEPDGRKLKSFTVFAMIYVYVVESQFRATSDVELLANHLLTPNQQQVQTLALAPIPMESWLIDYIKASLKWGDVCVASCSCSFTSQ